MRYVHFGIILLLLLIEFNYYQPTSDPIEAGIQFMTQKGLCKDNPEQRTQHFTNLRNIPTLPPTLQHKYTTFQKRLNQILDKQKETILDKPPSPDVHLFSTSEFPGYDHTNLIFLMYPGSLVQRINKLSGLSYIEAPTVVQCYAVSKGNPRGKGMIDIVKLVKDHFTARELEGYFLDLLDSKEVLRRIVGEGEEVKDCEDVGLVVGEFEKYGVGLVRQFKVFEDFLNVSVHKHYGFPTGEFVGKHSMALVGYRREGDKLFFLLQNWFVEIDDEYLKESGAIVTFIVTPQLSIPSIFPSHPI